MPHLLVFNRSYYPDLGATGQLLTELCLEYLAANARQASAAFDRPVQVRAYHDTLSGLL